MNREARGSEGSTLGPDECFPRSLPARPQGGHPPVFRPATFRRAGARASGLPGVGDLEPPSCDTGVITLSGFFPFNPRFPSLRKSDFVVLTSYVTLISY